MAVTTSEPPPASSLPIIRLAALRLTLIALVLGLCANVLFVNHPLGLNFPLFTLWTLAALLTLAALERVRPAWRNLWLAAPLIYFAAMTAVRAEPFVTFLNVCTALGLAMLLAHLFASGSLATFGVWDYVTVPMLTSVEAGVVRPGLVLIAARTEAVRPGGASPRALAVLRGLGLAIPLYNLSRRGAGVEAAVHASFPEYCNEWRDKVVVSPHPLGLFTTWNVGCASGYFPGPATTAMTVNVLTCEVKAPFAPTVSLSAMYDALVQPGNKMPICP